ncbi:ornithine decarboxylase [Glutamicibacter sp. MNS18]|uniref:aminotransferase class I/II-fold pyridoxal phosphate-dependent enzyme n=1 Tax=Glutamicibacter sp. MNS18 TaxID=2989817 RepID=UPI002235A99A|nr:ornithine decarboxylase [Glutamicibacter sp. MNS18]MCW4465745.1 ornithine decarboxylase [Glutamicibacter sp. MNS18]
MGEKTDSGTLVNEARQLIGLIAAIEPYWATPGISYFNDMVKALESDDYSTALEKVYLVNKTFRSQTQYIEPENNGHEVEDEEKNSLKAESNERFAPVVEVLLVDNGRAEEIEGFKQEMLDQRRSTDKFNYNFVVVPSVEDALVALVINPTIQTCVLTPRFEINTKRKLSSALHGYIQRQTAGRFSSRKPMGLLIDLESTIARLRPEVAVYLVAGVALESLAREMTGRFQRIFSRNDGMDLHLSIINEILSRYETPFFTALQHYARRPAGVFHAMPISRAGSVQNSPWARDLVDFYGINLLLAETSATSGGLDSLLDPHGSIREAHELASRAFGSHLTYFVTNGTSTANKIVHQSILAPGDIVLVDRNCHKSHHYSLVLAGAHVKYLEAYPLQEHSMYGAVPLSEIKSTLLHLRREGMLHKVKMITLTNCTFDGIIYDPRRVMEECLAIKPDLVFLWDEAWFAFAGFHPIYRKRTGMSAARTLESSMGTAEYRRRYKQQVQRLPEPGTKDNPANDDAWLNTRLIPDPEKTRLRIYSTQSTHKTLTSLRQGSMIHVYDQDYVIRNSNSFREAYMTHTSTSPNYQILASLDIGRRQAELEGYALVQRQVDLALSVSKAIARHKLLRKYFSILDSRDLIPQEYRVSGNANPVRDGLASWDDAWETDEFVVDPSRLTLDISRTGVDGDTFKHTYLMDGHAIQVNKTSRTSVLLMTNIGTNRSAVSYLIEVLIKIATDLEHRRRLDGRSAEDLKASAALKVPLPNFSYFARAFDGGAQSGDMRRAYYLTYRDPATTFHLSDGIRERIAAGQEVVSAAFVTPYPPGFPVLVPGQVITTEILDYMDMLDTREIHGYHRDYGYQVFTSEAVAELEATDRRK